MNGISRVLSMTLRYRFTLAGVFISSILMSVLWSANISVVYPFVEVVFLGKTMQEWSRGEITKLEREVVETEAQILANKNLPEAATPQERARRTSQIDLLSTKLDVARRGISWMHRIQPWIDQYVPTTPFRTLLAIVGVLLLGSILKDFFLVANILLVERLVQLILLDLRKKFFRRTLRLDMASFSEHPSSELMARFTNDISALSQGLNNLIGKAVREPLRMLACLIGAACVSWQLLLFSLLIAPPCLLAIRFLSKSLKRNSRKALTEVGVFFQRLSETFTGMQTVKAFSMERFERVRFHRTAKAIYHVAMKISMYSALAKPVTELFGIGVICLALIAGTYLVLNEQTHILGIKMCDRPLSSPALLLFFSMLCGVADPARKLSDIFGIIEAGSAASERLFPLIDRQARIADPPHPETPPRPHGVLVFENVSFHYPAGPPVLHKVNLKIPFGETIAIVGPNGCGKTSLINLLLRFYDPVEGSIRFDHTDTRAIRLRDLRDRIGTVSQTTHLFDDTIKNNIRYGSPHATDEEVVAAAEQAHAHQFILEKLSNGYETKIGQGGSRLSGGQRQRIALARAILRDPDILILDEATSQIDIESEQLIHEALETFIAGRTAIMITHRLSTLSLADRIVVMESGVIIDVGTHRELLDRCPLYQRLHEVQFRQSA